MSYWLRTTAVIGVVAIVAGVASHLGHASRGASKVEIKAIGAAVAGAHVDCRGCTWKVAHVRVSTVDAHFAVADEVGRRNGQPIQGAKALLWHGVSKWAVISEGSDVGIGCGYVNAAVRKDLFATSICP
jgi:hypothetical protein